MAYSPVLRGFFVAKSHAFIIQSIAQSASKKYKYGGDIRSSNSG